VMALATPAWQVPVLAKVFTSAVATPTSRCEGAKMPWKTNSSSGFPLSVPWGRLLPTMALAILTVVLGNAVVDAWRASTAHATVVTAPRNPSPLKLHAWMGAEQMEISWDHDAAAVKEADHATLEILDGEVTESVPFESKQLQDGVLVYRPHTNDVSVRMVVEGRTGEKITESVRAVRRP